MPPQLLRYKKRYEARVIAIKLNLETKGFSYKKWGETQVCKPGDWIVYNNDETYTVDNETFLKTYKQVSFGVYAKNNHIWAETAQHSGAIKTKEGETHFKSGDYLVYNDIERKDGYAITHEVFNKLYELVE